jgi:hypothetical protein
MGGQTTSGDEAASCRSRSASLGVEGIHRSATSTVPDRHGVMVRHGVLHPSSPLVAQAIGRIDARIGHAAIADGCRSRRRHCAGPERERRVASWRRLASRRHGFLLRIRADSHGVACSYEVCAQFVATWSSLFPDSLMRGLGLPAVWRWRDLLTERIGPRAQTPRCPSESFTTFDYFSEPRSRWRVEPSMWSVASMWSGIHEVLRTTSGGHRFETDEPIAPSATHLTGPPALRILAEHSLPSRARESPPEARGPRRPGAKDGEGAARLWPVQERGSR